MKTKSCARCKETLPTSAFPPNIRLKSGLHSYCKPCRLAKNAERPKNGRVGTVKRCTACGRTLEASCFMSNVNSGDGLRSRCKDCTSSDQTLRKYGLSSDQYEAMAIDGCHICGSYTRLHVDHDHACCPFSPSGSTRLCGSCIRGILCSNCNTGLGLFHEDPKSLLKAVAYLEHQPT